MDKEWHEYYMPKQAVLKVHLSTTHLFIKKKNRDSLRT